MFFQLVPYIRSFPLPRSVRGLSDRVGRWPGQLAALGAAPGRHATHSTPPSNPSPQARPRSLVVRVEPNRREHSIRERGREKGIPGKEDWIFASAANAVRRPCTEPAQQRQRQRQLESISGHGQREHAASRTSRDSIRTSRHDSGCECCGETRAPRESRHTRRARCLQ